MATASTLVVWRGTEHKPTTYIFDAFIDEQHLLEAFRLSPGEWLLGVSCLVFLVWINLDFVFMEFDTVYLNELVSLSEVVKHALFKETERRLEYLQTWCWGHPRRLRGSRRRKWCSARKLTEWCLQTGTWQPAALKREWLDYPSVLNLICLVYNNRTVIRLCLRLQLYYLNSIYPKRSDQEEAGL